MSLRLMKPDLRHKDLLMNYKREFEANNEILHGSAGLEHFNDFREWLGYLRDNEDHRTVRDDRVPSETYIVIRVTDGALVGMIDIRRELNDYLYQFGGHIGFSVRKDLRGRGYATEMLRQALSVCKANQMDKLLITCAKGNMGSAMAIMHNGGLLENEVEDGDGNIIQRYWIDLS